MYIPGVIFLKEKKKTRKQPEKKTPKYSRIKSLLQVKGSLTNHPASLRSWLRLAEIYLKEKIYRKAVFCLETAISLYHKPLENQLSPAQLAFMDQEYKRAQFMLYTIKSRSWKGYCNK